MQIKICGLTTAKQAEACVKAGADAIGVVFYPPSPRNVSVSAAQDIQSAIAGKAKLVGVFVDMPFDEIVSIAAACKLDTLQLHGSEGLGYVAELKYEGVRIVKALKDEQAIKDAPKYVADAFLLELGKGILPGGNGAAWDFSKAESFAFPFALAGGINIDNVESAISGARPDAIDLSSSVESAPGVKDMELVKEIIMKARAVAPSDKSERVF